tara:strand:+ start:702 stop:1160 length:459 start_codon:yes stop_codon:yes gene_type:complete
MEIRRVDKNGVEAKEERIRIRVTPEFKQRIESVSGKEGISEFVRKAVEDRLDKADNEVRDSATQQFVGAMSSALEHVEDSARELRKNIHDLAKPVLVCCGCGLPKSITPGYAEVIRKHGRNGGPCKRCNGEMKLHAPDKMVSPDIRRLLGWC